MRHFSIMHLEGHNTGNGKSHHGNTVILPVIPRVLLPWYYYCPAIAGRLSDCFVGFSRVFAREAGRPGAGGNGFRVPSLRRIYYLLVSYCYTAKIAHGHLLAKRSPEKKPGVRTYSGHTGHGAKKSATPRKGGRSVKERAS